MVNRHLLTIIPGTKTPKIATLSVNHLIAITDDERGIAQALAQQLKMRGYQKVQIVKHIPPESDVVILLDALKNFVNEEEAIACHQRIFLHAQQIAERFTHKGGIFITVQATGGQFGFEKFNPISLWTAGISGFTKTAAAEWPKSICQAIDVVTHKQSPEVLANHILNQFFMGHPDGECGINSKGETITTKLIPIILEADKNPIFEKSSVIVVSGGARGITASCLLALAKNCQLRFVLLGRTTLSPESPLTKELKTENELKKTLLAHAQLNHETLTPATLTQQVKEILAQREIENNINALKQMGSEVLYFTMDILNLEELENTLAQVRQEWGNIDAIIHGAGVLADKLITEKTLDQFNRVFNTKVYGLKNLLAAVKKDKLSAIILFSSVAARFGNAGQCDYAMANELLNKIAQQEQINRGKRCLVKSLNWGPWESGMVTPELKAHFAKRGIELLSEKIGTQLFIAELQDNNKNNVEVVLGSTITRMFHQFATARSKNSILTSFSTKNQQHVDGGHAQKDALYAPADFLSAESEGLVFRPLATQTGETFRLEKNKEQQLAKTASTSYSVHQSAYPFLSSHQVDNTPILPACLVMEWFIHAAMTFCPDASFYACRHFKILRGAQCLNFYKTQDNWTIHCEYHQQNETENILNLKLYSAAHTLHYTAQIIMRPANHAEKSNAIPFAKTAVDPWPWDVSDVYNRPQQKPLKHRLFHGPDLHVIKTLDTFSHDGGSGLLCTLPKNIADIAPWQTDWVILDGILQLLSLWSFSKIHYPTLPTQIQEVNLYDRKIASNHTHLHCYFTGKTHGKYRTVSDVILENDQGQIYAHMKGLEMFAMKI